MGNLCLKGGARVISRLQLGDVSISGEQLGAIVVCFQQAGTNNADGDISTTLTVL